MSRVPSVAVGIIPTHFSARALRLVQHRRTPPPVPVGGTPPAMPSSTIRFQFPVRFPLPLGLLFQHVYSSIKTHSQIYTINSVKHCAWSPPLTPPIPHGLPTARQTLNVPVKGALLRPYSSFSVCVDHHCSFAVSSEECAVPVSCRRLGSAGRALSDRERVCPAGTPVCVSKRNCTCNDPCFVITCTHQAS